MGLEFLSKLADPYDRQAWLYPVLIAMVPVLAIVTGVYGVAFKFDSAFFGLITSFGIFYLLSTVGREFGKRLEAPLYVKWGGKTSIQLLRHSNTVIDVVTKKRYHEFLENHLGEKFPTLDEEIANQSGADEKYRAV